MGRLRALDDATVLAIVNRCNEGISQTRVGREFGVAQPTVSQIMRGRHYQDVTGINGPSVPERRSFTEVQQDNVGGVRMRHVYVHCLNCRRLVEKQAGTVLDADGAILCNICKADA